MIGFVVHRVMQALVVMAVISLLVFIGVYAIGNPIDVLISPTSPCVAFPVGAIEDPMTMYLNDICTIPSNLSGSRRCRCHSALALTACQSGSKCSPPCWAKSTCSEPPRS